jgi:hypothetical protein
MLFQVIECGYGEFGTEVAPDGFEDFIAGNCKRCASAIGPVVDNGICGIDSP